MDERNTGLDCLKIISMFMVVVLHVLGYTGGLVSENAVIYYISWLIESFCYVAVDCFALTTGYVMCTKQFSLRRIIDFCVQVITVSLFVYILAIVLRIENFTFSGLLVSAFPITTGGYWFAQAYLVVLFASPIINYGVQEISLSQLKIIVFAMILFFSVFPTCIYRYGWDVGEKGYILLIFLYFFGAVYRRIFQEMKIKTNLLIYGGGYCISTLILYFSFVILSFLYMDSESDSSKAQYFFQYNSVFVVCSAFCLFGFFQQYKRFQNRKWPRKISSCVFTVYLLHMQPVIKYLYRPKFHTDTLAGSGYYFGKVLIGAVSVFLLGIILEIFRKNIMGKIVGMRKKY